MSKSSVYYLFRTLIQRPTANIQYKDVHKLGHLINLDQHKIRIKSFEIENARTIIYPAA